jgi:predicted amidohydrolase YtcJ
MLIQRARLIGGSTVDIRVQQQIVEVAPQLTPTTGEPVLDAAHRTVIPGLHDHHVHLHSAAAALSSVRVGPREVAGRDDLAAVVARATVGDDGWIRAIGYHEAVAGPLDRTTLDEVSPATPVRVQHRSGVLWTLNTAGLERVGLADHPDGRLRSADTSWSDALQRRETELSAVSRRLASYGVTGVTDATPDLGIDDVVKFAEARQHGGLLQRVHCLAPGKRILHDDALDLVELEGWIGARHAAGGPVAVHCVTAAQLVVTIAALRLAGAMPGDRIEHAAVVPADCLTDLAELGVTVVTQPNFVCERGDQYLADVDAEEHPLLWRLASLQAANVAVALSTDMPFGDADPWAAMRAAVNRTTGSGAVLGSVEAVPARTALELFFGEAQRPTRLRTIAPGQPADLCLIAAEEADLLAALDSGAVAVTVVDGKVVFDSGREGRSGVRWLPLRERPSEELDLRGDEVPRHQCLRRQAVEAVERAVDHLDVAADARIAEPVGVLEVLVVEQVQRADADPRRWQSAEVVTARGHGDRRVGVAEVAAPAVPVR